METCVRKGENTIYQFSWVNIVLKGEKNGGDQHLLLFPTMLIPLLEKLFLHLVPFWLSSVTVILVQYIILSFGKELTTPEETMHAKPSKVYVLISLSLIMPDHPLYRFTEIFTFSGLHP